MVLSLKMVTFTDSNSFIAVEVEGAIIMIDILHVIQNRLCLLQIGIKDLLTFSYFFKHLLLNKYILYQN